jgi:type III secretion system FlhB-like substrate exporter
MGNSEVGTRNVEFKTRNSKPGTRNWKQILLFIIIFLSLIPSCSIKKTVVNSTALFMDDVMDGFFAESDLQFASEAIPGNLKLLEGLIRASDGDNDGLLLKGCKLYAMYAMGFMEDAALDKKQDKENMRRASAFYGRARDYGLAVLKKNSDFKNAVEGNMDDFAKVMPAFGDGDLETLFWTAFAWGEYINLNRNSAETIADLPRVRLMMERVIEINDKYFYGLPHLFMIVYYSMPKMFGGDYDRAKKEYETIQGISGGRFVLADFFMARYYAVQVQDKALFEKLLGNVEAADDNVIPERLFTQVAKKKALILKMKENDLF